MSQEYNQRIDKAKAAFLQADYLIIGAGAGLSDAAGIKYSGPRFTDNFSKFIDKYGFRDLYSSSFYPFKTEEERWAYWAKHISLNRYEIPATQLYKDLFDLANSKENFVLTTNVESQFSKAGFNKENIFAVQGDYGLLQCAKACHKKLYSNEKMVIEMLDHTDDCRIPAELVPHCPKCGGKMDVNLRKDSYFVEDDNWQADNKSYAQFVQKALKGKLVLLELGVGFNTPGIIRYPFEQITSQNQAVTLIRINTQHAFVPDEIETKSIIFKEDMSQIINDLF